MSTEPAAQPTPEPAPVVDPTNPAVLLPPATKPVEGEGKGTPAAAAAAAPAPTLSDAFFDDAMGANAPQQFTGRQLQQQADLKEDRAALGLVPPIAELPEAPAAPAVAPPTPVQTPPPEDTVESLRAKLDLAVNERDDLRVAVGKQSNQLNEQQPQPTPQSMEADEQAVMDAFSKRVIPGWDKKESVDDFAPMTYGDLRDMVWGLTTVLSNGVEARVGGIEAEGADRTQLESLAAHGISREMRDSLLKEKSYLARLTGPELEEALVDAAGRTAVAPTAEVRAPQTDLRPVDLTRHVEPSSGPADGGYPLNPGSVATGAVVEATREMKMGVPGARAKGGRMIDLMFADLNPMNLRRR